MATYLDTEPVDESTPPDRETVLEDMDLGLQELKDSLGDYKEAEKYFLGEAEEKFISDKLRRMLSGSASDFHVNLAGRVVYAVTDRLEIAGFTASPAGDRPEDEEDSEISNESSSGSGAENDLTATLMEQVWRHSNMAVEAPDIHEKATSLGDAYLYVGLDRDGKGVDVFYNSPLTTRAIYDEENPREIRFVIKCWKVGRGDKQKTRVNLYYPYFHFKFISKRNADKKSYHGTKAVDFEVYTDEFTDADGVVDYGYREIPFFHFRTRRPYGRPEHKDAYGPQDAITKLIAGQMTSTDFAAYPQRWALSEPGSTGNDDDLDWGDDEDEEPGDKESALVSGPGRVWMLNNVKSVGQFQTADPDAFLKPLDKFIELMGSTTGTPLSYLHKVRGTSSTPLSGESQRQTEVMLLKKIEARQNAYQATWEEALEFALKLLGHDARVNVQWASALVDSGKGVWDGVLAQQSAGVPKRQTLLEQGYTERQCEKWGYTEENPNGEGIEPAEDDPFARNAGAPLPDDMKSTQFGEGNQAGGNNQGPGEGEEN